ncbi:unnamed protein product [Meganyctiphanes norvegica]|uniref:WAP domain-containing protein n=1 Tax=Meganyctiphanes norvegica TaxID=48144 RepID=A0AAV2QMU3_MEGNR
MSAFIYNILIPMILCQYTYAHSPGSSEELGDRLTYSLSPGSSEELDIGFKSSNGQVGDILTYSLSPASSEELNNGQYYNSREAHGDIIEIIDGTNVTRYNVGNSDENSNEEQVHSLGTIFSGLLFKSGAKFEDAEDETRIVPGMHQDHPSSEIDLPLCSGRKKDKKQGKCNEEQNLCRGTGDCRIARIWGTCCLSPGCGTYCKPNRSRCPHPNSLKEACDESDKVCNPLGDDCQKGTSCCQVLPCGYRCVQNT